MRILTIGDIHGRPYWKDIIDKNEFDLVVFCGDYTDPYEIEDHIMIANLLEIIKYKEENPETTELLLGNHELHYLFSYGTHGCTRFNRSLYEQFHKLFLEKRHLFKVAFQIENYLWTHAGVSNAWYKQFFEFMPLDIDTSFADKINQVFNSNKEWIVTQIGYARGGMRGDSGGPLWADYDETSSSPFHGCHQFVGHTPVKTIHTLKGDDWSYTYCDVLQHTKEGFIVEINKD